MSVINATPLLAAAGGDYQISRSVRLRSSASAYFNRTPASSSGQQTFTISAWAKRGTLSAEQVVFGINSASTNIFTVAFLSGDTFRIFGRNAGSDVLNLTTTAVYRDPSAWYHIVIAIDTTQATSSNRARIYVNGVEVTAFGTATYPAQNTSLAWNSNSYAHDIGRESTGNYFDGYLTEINHISGSQLTPSSFGETDSITGVWKPKKYAGTYGTNGFYLNFSDNSSNTATTIGKDYSGNGNNWTPNNISVTSGATYDSMIDVPTLYADGGNGRGNYCTLNPLSGNSATITDGNLSAGFNASQGRMGTIAVNSGKWYWECSFVTSFSDVCIVGIANQQDPNVFITSPTGYGYYSNANKVNNSSAVAYGATFGVSDTVGVAIDLDAGSLTFYKNGTSQGVAYTGLSGTFCPAFATNGSGSSNFRANFGQRPFAYTPPTGFKALNTQNLPEPTIKKGNQYFDATLYSGNSSSQTVTNSGGMQPDLVWIKSRNVSGNNHNLWDAVRGAGKALFSNLTDAEGTAANMTGFTSSGFSFSGTAYDSNTTGNNLVGWQWKESASAGFDIVTYTGTGSAKTVAHNLGVAPKMIIAKNRGGTSSWAVYHASIGAGNAVYLDLTQASSATTNWNSTAPTSSVFSVGTAGEANPSGGNLVAYLFAEVAGFSKFGSYTGNGSADGPMIFTGFRPAFIILKRTDSTGNWSMYDSARSTYNASTRVLYPNLSNSEDASTDHFDWLSNGFKMRSTNQNTSGGTFIFMAFATNPFKNSLAV